MRKKLTTIIFLLLIILIGVIALNIIKLFQNANTTHQEHNPADELIIPEETLKPLSLEEAILLVEAKYPDQSLEKIAENDEVFLFKITEKDTNEIMTYCQINRYTKNITESVSNSGGNGMGD